MGMIRQEKLLPEGEWGLWAITEAEASWKGRIVRTEEEDKEWEKMSERRRVEWTAARWFVHRLSGRELRAEIKKDEFGKPFIEDSTMCISISHSKDRVAVIASPYRVGIDVQEIVEKMERISVKFVHDEEWKNVPKENGRLTYLHVLWGAKEAMYKAWGKRGVDFKEQMKVERFDWKKDLICTEGRLIKDHICMVFDLYAERIEQYILVYAIEKYRTCE